MGSQSTGIPTKQESKLGILEYTYTEAMPSRERERETLQLLGFECGFVSDGFGERKLDKRPLKGEEGKVRQSETTTKQREKTWRRSLTVKDSKSHSRSRRALLNGESNLFFFSLCLILLPPFD
jgi:hypothetical protein